MTLFEFAYCSLELCMNVHYVKVRRILKKLCKGSKNFQLLDVGGQKSHYTTNLNCDVHIVDLPRESEVQQQLHLGLTHDMLEEIKRRRSNIKSIDLQDITKTTFKNNTFDGIVSVEVIEHIQDDSAFIYQIHRILKPGGCVVLTTPNGEAVENINPDHFRHYTRAELETKVRECFDKVELFYGVREGFLYNMSIKGWTCRKRILIAPFLMFCRFLANLLEGVSSGNAKNTKHLFAIARKKERIDE